MENINDKLFTCNICDKSFASYQSLGAHRVSHIKRNLINCEICNKRFGKLQIEKHIEICKETFFIKKLCAQCGVEIKKYNTFCSKTCSNHHRRPSKEQKLKTSKSLKGRQYNKELYTEKQCKHCKKNISPIQGKKTPTICKPRCDEAFANLSSSLSKALKGKAGGYREGGGRGKGASINGIWFDSTWEIEFAKRLDSLKIKWSRDYKNHKFEYTDLDGRNRKYYPDFYLDDFKIYVEVKGYWTAQTKYKMEQVIKNNQNQKFLILESIEEIQNFIL